MRSGIAASPAGESPGTIGLLCRLGGRMSTVMYRVADWADRAAPAMPFPRTQGISARKTFNR